MSHLAHALRSRTQQSSLFDMKGVNSDTPSPLSRTTTAAKRAALPASEADDSRTAAEVARVFMVATQVLGACIVLFELAPASPYPMQRLLRLDFSFFEVILLAVWVLFGVVFNLAFIRAWKSSPGIPHDAGANTDSDGNELRWCNVCRIWQPLRTKHCLKCEVWHLDRPGSGCVPKYDHHCFWLGTCIGQKNHARFIAVVVSAAAYLATSTVVAGQCFLWNGRLAFVTNVWHNGVVILFMIAAGAMTVFAAALAIMHVHYAATGQTTWEYWSASRISYMRNDGRTVRRAPFSCGNAATNIALLWSGEPNCGDRWRLGEQRAGPSAPPPPHSASEIL